MPKLSNKAVSSLNAPITGAEIEEILKVLTSGKSPGSDGDLHYKMFNSRFTLSLVTLYNAFLEGT